MTKTIDRIQTLNIWLIAICIMVMMSTILIGDLQAAAIADILIVANSISYVAIHKIKEIKSEEL